ncbi:type II secretion system F family protein [Ilumatobacter nonamiensis]|uniref:type II secretion system F family protein n=1 Tax=Ilumatobacter nonamiensis TaxID=467093 RepID=UPI00034A1558|nr:type II secretion system F family protein [Ilumatobacter nonamiensis]
MIVVPVTAAVVTALVLSTTTGCRPTRRAPSDRQRSERRFRPRNGSGRPWDALHRRHHLEPAGVAAWCDELARGLRHGSTLRSVIAGTVPDDAAVAQHTAFLRHRLERGSTVSAACDDWSVDLERDPASGIDALHTFAAVLSATAALGGNTAEPIDRFGVAMRQRASDRLERGANSAQARMSARVLTVVPLAMLALLLATDGDVRATVTSASGATVVGIGLVLNTVGAWWMRRIAGAPAPTAPRATSGPP